MQGERNALENHACSTSSPVRYSREYLMSTAMEDVIQNAEKLYTPPVEVHVVG